MRTVTLYRPVGPKELKLIQASGWREFPPRLPDQPIFYPITNEDYAPSNQSQCGLTKLSDNLNLADDVFVERVQALRGNPVFSMAAKCDLNAVAIENNSGLEATRIIVVNPFW